MMIHVRIYIAWIWLLFVTTTISLVSVNVSYLLIEKEDITIIKIIRVDGWFSRLSSVIRIEGSYIFKVIRDDL